MAEVLVRHMIGKHTVQAPDSPIFVDFPKVKGIDAELRRRLPEFADRLKSPSEIKHHFEIQDRAGRRGVLLRLQQIHFEQDGTVSANASYIHTARGGAMVEYELGPKNGEWVVTGEEIVGQY